MTLLARYQAALLMAIDMHGSSGARRQLRESVNAITAARQALGENLETIAVFLHAAGSEVVTKRAPAHRYGLGQELLESVAKWVYGVPHDAGPAERA